jgi:diguanylate cyclase
LAIPNVSDEQLRKALRELDQAVYNHEQWAEALYGTLICRLAPDQRDISADSHRKCQFGQWYYRDGIVALEGYSGITEIGTEHERMHQYAASLLRSSVDGVQISFGDYERFVIAMKRLRLRIASVQRELEDALYRLDPLYSLDPLMERMRLEIASVQRQLEDALHRQDPLTGTPSRAGMLVKLHEQHELVIRRVQQCAIAMVDLDRFKAVNDKYGHAVGDNVLISFARFLMAHLRPYDKLFRYGGEEFLICLPATDLQTGHHIVDRLREEFGLLPHETDNKRIFHVTFSAGLTLLDPEISMEQSIDRADKALYVAKAKGRNRLITWDASMNISPALSEGSA